MNIQYDSSKGLKKNKGCCSGTNKLAISRTFLNKSKSSFNVTSFFGGALVVMLIFTILKMTNDTTNDIIITTPKDQRLNLRTVHHDDNSQQHDMMPSIPTIAISGENKEMEKPVGSEGGAWNAATHLSEYGFNVDQGLVEVLESSCRDIENSRIPDNEVKWHQYHNDDRGNPLNGFWVKPDKYLNYVNCKVLEIGCGVGVYVDALKKDQQKIKRTVIGIEPNEMGGTFKRRNGPKQLAINILATDDQEALAKKIVKDHLSGSDGFDLIYSIEVFEHMPPDRHEDAVKFMAAAARKGTKLIFGSARRGQIGVGHIGLRKGTEWEKILAKYDFVKHVEDTIQATGKIEEYNHRVNTQVYYYKGKDEVV